MIEVASLSQRVEPTDSWFRVAPPLAATDRALVCLPHAGGGASAFSHWKALLGEETKVLAVQYPGHEGRWQEALCTRISDIAYPLASVIASWSHPNLVLFGHSLGAVIAFEVVRILRRLECPEPRHLFVSGSAAPDAPRRQPPIHSAPTTEFMDHLSELGGIPKAVLLHHEIMDLFLPILRADIGMAETYEYKADALLDIPITAFIGSEDDITLEEAAAWGRQTRRPFHLEMFRAGHWWPPDCEAKILGIIARSLNELATMGKGHL